MLSSTKDNYSFSLKRDAISPYFPSNIAGLEGFTFISDGYPLLETGSAPCYSKLPDPQTQRGISRHKTSTVDGFVDYGEAHYNALFPRPSIRDERMRDMRDIVIIDNSLYLIGSVTIVTLLIGGIFIASFNKNTN